MANMNFEKVKSQMHSLAFGEAMGAAAEDYKKELIAAERAAAAGPSHQQIDVDDLLDDPELDRLHAERLAALKEEAEKRAQLQRSGHGSYQEVAEGDFLEACTKAGRLVCHFFHREFERCKILDRHLTDLARRHLGTRFIKLSVMDAPFFVEKLQVRTLPCLLAFVDGVAVDRVVGFGDLGGKDDFPTAKLEARLLTCGVIAPPPPPPNDSDDEGSNRRTVRFGAARQKQHRTGSDEDSDFD